MAFITYAIEVDHPPHEVFSRITDPARFVEWQPSLVSVQGGRGPLGVGSRYTATRRVAGRERTMTAEITEISPPRRWACRGVDGPVRAITVITIEPLNKNTRSRVTIELDFEAHGIGRLLVPLVIRPTARKEISSERRALQKWFEK